MWKLALGFIIFAAIALFTILKGGEVDMSGERHGVEAAPAVAPAASAASGV
jgi:hypothetical protein